jgi:hypothetical protein
MGMFDYVRSEVPLPDGFTGELQTKDFACEMAVHTIRSDGRLILARLDHTEVIPKSERPYPNDDGLLGLAGSLRCHWWHEDANFHGILNFYGSEYELEDGQPYRGRGVLTRGSNHRGDKGQPLTRKWHEYNAKFTDGKLVSIDIVPDC